MSQARGYDAQFLEESKGRHNLPLSDDQKTSVQSQGSCGFCEHYSPSDLKPKEETGQQILCWNEERGADSGLVAVGHRLGY